MNVTGMSIKPLSNPVNGDTRDREIVGYAIVDGSNIIIGEFASFGLASAAWDMIVSMPEPEPTVGCKVCLPILAVPEQYDGAQEAL